MNGVIDDTTATINGIRECLSGYPAADRVMFGTDSILHDVSYRTEDFIGKLTDSLGQELCTLLMSINPRSFLFGESGKIPERISRLF